MSRDAEHHEHYLDDPYYEIEPDGAPWALWLIPILILLLEAGIWLRPHYIPGRVMGTSGPGAGIVSVNDPANWPFERAQCQFDNTQQTGDLVIPSEIEAGKCHDTGVTWRLPF